METDASFYVRLGYGQLDLSAGDWQASDDVAGFTNVRHPERDQKFQVRELLRIFGKRFATAEAGLIWREIESYTDEIVRRYGPPQGAVGRISFEQAAHDWYDRFGRAFEKNWYLTTAALDLNYARAGREKVKGRWLRWLYPDLVYFVEAGFTPAQILRMLKITQGSWWHSGRTLRQVNDTELSRVWVGLAARLLNFNLSDENFEAVQAEVAEHSARLSHWQKRPVAPALAAIDYFQRLELGQLGPEILA